jgi:divalent metal cation (Fe/Co/Zn/Cd) transporter
VEDGASVCEEDEGRLRLVGIALILVTISVCWGGVAGALSITLGLRSHSLSVLGVGLSVLADVAGSATLIWRFRAERRMPDVSGLVEARAVIVVSAALAVACGVLAVEAIHALLVRSHPTASTATLAIAAASVVVLAPLAVGKRRLGARLVSRALKGDGTLSAIGASTALLALVSLLVYREYGLWWADRVAALAIAVVAGIEAYRTARAS